MSIPLDSYPAGTTFTGAGLSPAGTTDLRTAHLDQYTLAVACLALLGLLASTDAAAQCAMCKTALESPEGRQLASAFRRGVLLLLAAPVSTVATIGFLVLRARRRQRGQLVEGPSLS